jgi:hypothetical protein
LLDSAWVHGSQQFVWIHPVRALPQMLSMRNMRRAQQTSTETFKNFDKNFVFARKGTAAQWVEYFDTDLVPYYEQLKQQYRFDLYI